MKFFAFIFLAAAATLRAQTPAPSPTASLDPTRQPLWRCELPGGTYEVALRAVISVSSHEYLVDGAARVTEVNLDTTGSMTVRFYFIEPITPQSPIGLGQSAIDRAQELAKEVAGRTGQDAIWEKVVKNYPTTTHARTIEYRLESADQLRKVFESAESAFRLGKNTTLKLK
ncbi:MAG: hypothetical protein QOD99_3212 [Chthoniobacter sp.]|jgi:hypothetical protein|nr:hypothetical protein [Chthoniobacter sp.]